MAVEYASKYGSQVDERFKLGSLTGAVTNNSYDFIGVETVKVFSIPTVGMNDYKTSGANRYGDPSELGNNVQEMTLSQDRSFTFTIDRKSYDDTQMTMEAGKALARQIDEVVIPEVDIYRIHKICASAKVANIVAGATTKTNAYENFLSVQEKLDDNKVPSGGRICLCRSSYYKNIKLDDAFTKKGDMATQIAINGVVGEVDGVPIIKVPASYFPANVDFVITNSIVCVAPIKLTEYKIHTDAPGISGWLVEGRVRYDAFCLNEKLDAIGVHATAALKSIAITTAPTKTAYTSGEAFDAAGMVVTATYDDNSTQDVTKFATWSPDVITAAGNVTVSYTENGVTKTATQAVTVA
jgi:hypothetical protein